MKIKSGKAISFNRAVKNAKIKLKEASPNDLKSAAKLALRAVKGIAKKKHNNRSRIIPVPKSGGILPLIPIFAGLSALGALAGGTASVVNAVNKAKQAQAELKESQRHNKTMESIALGKGLYLKPYKKGLGIFLRRRPTKHNKR